MTAMIAAIDQTIWASPLATLGGVFVTALATLGTTLIVQRANRRHVEAQAHRAEVESDRIKVETSVLVEKAEDDDHDRDMVRMQKTLDFTFGALDRLSNQVEKYERQIVEERTKRETQLDEHATHARRRMDDIQRQADERHEHVMAEVEALRRETANNRRRILAHVPWDLRAAAALRAKVDPEFPDPPEL